MTATYDKDEPYCNHCGHRLRGLVDSSKCPECGRPLVEVLVRGGRFGRRFRSRTTLFGLPVVDVAFGPVPGERAGRARGIFAFGDRATGVVAFGGQARGVVAVGGFAIGIFSFGGFSVGLLGAWGGFALGVLAYGGFALGLLSTGGLALGWCATGGIPIGVYAAGGAPIGVHRIGPGARSAEAAAMLDQLSWFFGGDGAWLWIFLQPLLVIIGLALVAVALAGLLVVLKMALRPRADEPAA